MPRPGCAPCGDDPPEPVLRIVGGTGPARLLARVGKTDPASLESYRAAGGYQALARAIELGPEGVIAEVGASRLLGRGGAAFPTARKWDAVRRQAAMPHYVVCNADESEPGTFKDRVLLESDPFAVIEAMTICGLATASRYGFLYIRGEYPLRRDADARCHRVGAGRRVARARRHGIGRGIRHRDPPRWRRLHLRRGDGALQLD